jgi:hypothetical protein
MIIRFDIQLGMQGSHGRIGLTRRATELVANLLNDFIHDLKDRQIGAVLDRYHRALEFVYRELADVLAGAATARHADKRLSSVDLLHWIAPRWPDVLRGPARGFVFDKE